MEAFEELFQATEKATPKTRGGTWWILLAILAAVVVGFLAFKAGATASAVKPVAAPEFVVKEVPSTIDLIRGGAQQSAETLSGTELAKQVGLSVKETLVQFKQLSAPTVGGIVAYAVKAVLATQTETTPPESVPQQAVRPTETRRASSGGRISIRGEKIPVEDPDDFQQTDSKPEKKINADSNPALLERAKQREAELKRQTETLL